MAVQYFTMDSIPDYTMAKYSIQEGNRVEDIIKQHASFYRQLHRRGLMFGEAYALLYQYDPSRRPGKRLQVFLRVDKEKEIFYMRESLQSTSLLNSFHIKECQVDQETTERYASAALLVKRDGFISSSIVGSPNQFYVTDKWKPNEKSRLMGMFRLMKALNRRCTYSVRLYPVQMAEAYRDTLQKQMKWMKPNGTGIGGQSQKDENAEKAFRIYNDTIDSLRTTPHFICEISSFADDEETAKLIVDAAASEAVEEGSYHVYAVSGKSFKPLLPHPFFSPKGNNVPTGLEKWNCLFLLKEIVPFACFPTLYPGETIEIPKETAPNYEKSGLLLGQDQQGYDVYFPYNLLTKHAFLAGVPGSGKTFTMLHLASQLAASETDIPILVLEPAKQEYRALALNPNLPDLTVFSPGGSGASPLRINPFEFPKGMKLAEHIVNLRQVFVGAFSLEPPMPFLLDQGIEKVYRMCGWYPFDYNDFNNGDANERKYPDMQMLYDEIDRLLNEVGYAEDVRNNLKSVLQVRIGSLVSRETGNVFNVPYSTFRPEEWMEHSCILELESLGHDAANFLTLLLATIIREYIKLNPRSEKVPRHVIFFEEAHNLIGPHTEAENGGNAKVASTKLIVDMLAEVRALNEAIIIADQLPTALASQVTKNTSLKIGLRITAQDDREMLASTMSADGVQLEQMALFTPGEALCMYEGVQKPFQVKITPYKGISKPPDNENLFAAQRKKKTYCVCMKRDMEIMFSRFDLSCKKMMYEWVGHLDTWIQLSEAKKQVLSIRDTNQRKKALKAFKDSQSMQCELIRRLYEKHLELILELVDYALTNRLMFKHITGKISIEFQNLLEHVWPFAKDKDPFMMDIMQDFSERYDAVKKKLA